MQLRLRRLSFFVCVAVAAAAAAVAATALVLLTHALLEKDRRFDIENYNQVASKDDNISPDERLASVCAVTTCGQEFLAEFTQHQKKPMIPPIRHILWKGEYVPNSIIPKLQTWQSIHPNWTFVLWRNADLEAFVSKHFPGRIHRKFKSLSKDKLHNNIKMDMIRYMLMYKFGGVYAHLNYTLVSSLDSYRRYPAVVTREPEVHVAQHYGLMKWPLPVLTNPDFFMSAPGHPFFYYVLYQLVEKEDSVTTELLGPFGLSRMLSAYYQMHLVMAHPTEFVYIPPSYSFYPYTDNRLSSEVGDVPKEGKISKLLEICHEASNSDVPQVRQFCNDVINLDPITDKKNPVVAYQPTETRQPVHDKYAFDSQDLRLYLKDLKLGKDFI